MNIGEFSRRSEVSAHTLRYYEKIGLLQPARRAASGHRVYDEHDLDWIGFVKRLRATEMPLAEISEYARLRARGDQTADARAALLSRHAAHLRTRIEAQQAHLARIEEKIRLYQPLEN